MTQRTENGITIITADSGKVFKRKNSSDVFGSEIALGYSHYIDGKKLDEPHLDTADDFEEVVPQNDIEL